MRDAERGEPEVWSEVTSAILPAESCFEISSSAKLCTGLCQVSFFHLLLILSQSMREATPHRKSAVKEMSRLFQDVV